jgi:predicted transposase/invertase (TIGR01784 family)
MNKPTFAELINNINDKIFKSTFTQTPSAVEYLNTFLTSVADKLDLENMILKDTNFVSEELEEYFSDVVYETTLKDPKLKNRIRVILLFEHKKVIESYFDLLLQLLHYIVLIWKQDRAEKRSPTIVIPLVINQGKKRLKEKSLHDVLKNIPKELLIYIPQFQFHLLNIQPFGKEPIDARILNLNSDNILRSLFLAYVAVEHKEKLQKALIEIFKFYKKSPHQKDFFHKLFVFLMQEGYFSGEEIEELKKEYLTTKEENKMMTNAQIWMQEGKQEGRQEGRQEGKHFVVLKGIHKKVPLVTLSDLTDISLENVSKLASGYESVKEAWLKKHTRLNKKELSLATMLTKEEIEYVIQCLGNKH